MIFLFVQLMIRPLIVQSVDGKQYLQLQNGLHQLLSEVVEEMANVVQQENFGYVQQENLSYVQQVNPEGNPALGNASNAER